MAHAQFQPTMQDRHPWVQVVLGKAQSGKTTYMNLVLQLWRRQVKGLSLAIDRNCTDPPQWKHLARWSNAWTADVPATLDKAVTLLACDEAAAYLGAGGIRGKFPVLEAAVFRGQHTGRWGLSCLLGTQRAKHIHPDVWSQAKRVVCFRTIDANDLQRIQDLAGMTDLALRMIPRLPPGYAVVWDERDGLFYPYVPEWWTAAART